MTPLSRLAGVVALVLPVPACSKAISVSGKVIPGDVSFIGAVDPGDPRLKSEGLTGADVSVRGAGGRDERILADAKSGKSGDFTVRIDDPDATSHPASFRAHLPGFADARQEMDVPGPDRRLLVILKPLSGSGAAK